uniref:Uncharacterized protein n=1 Tax=Trichogramma kaykai TaxID=54128 RepID=A0ABD2XJU6_9HYME
MYIVKIHSDYITSSESWKASEIQLMKKEPNEICSDVSNNYNFNSMDSNEVKNFEAFPVFKTSVSLII